MVSGFSFKIHSVSCFLFLKWNPVSKYGSKWILNSVSKCNSKCALKWAHVAFKTVPARYVPETRNLPPFAFKIGFRFQFQFQFQFQIACVKDSGAMGYGSWGLFQVSHRGVKF